MTSLLSVNDVFHVQLVWILTTKRKSLLRVENVKGLKLLYYCYVCTRFRCWFHHLMVLLSGYPFFLVYFCIEPWLFHSYEQTLLAKALSDTWTLLWEEYHCSVQVLFDRLVIIINTAFVITIGVMIGWLPKFSNFLPVSYERNINKHVLFNYCCIWWGL